MPSSYRSMTLAYSSPPQSSNCWPLSLQPSGIAHQRLSHHGPWLFRDQARRAGLHVSAMHGKSRWHAAALVAGLAHRLSMRQRPILLRVIIFLGFGDDVLTSDQYSLPAYFFYCVSRHVFLHSCSIIHRRYNFGFDRRAALPGGAHHHWAVEDFPSSIEMC